MREDFLHYIWKFKKFTTAQLSTVAGDPVELVSLGNHNLNAGPDFFNAQVRIGDQLWAGNVEIHLKSSDWYVHNHEQDPAYDNVILHVVWQHDADIFRKDNTAIPTLEIEPFVDAQILNNYQKLTTSKQKWIYCETDFASVDDFVLSNWLERLFIERLERKSGEVETLLKASKNNWEAVLFKMLTKTFGLKVNGQAFAQLANSLEWNTVKKLTQDQTQLEAVLMGQAGLLDESKEDTYYKNLQKEYGYCKTKFGLNNQHVPPVQFFRLRPPNFPTVRLAQLAGLYHSQPQLFSKLMEVKTVNEAYDLFKISVSDYWRTHYNFTSMSKSTSKKLTKSFIDLLLINTVLPLRYSYAKYRGQEVSENVLALAQAITAEKNSIVKKFNSIKKVATNALESQALLQLKNEYCNKQQCLQCAVGNAVLNR